MTPQEPHYRNHETLPAEDHIERCMRDAKLRNALADLSHNGATYRLLCTHDARNHATQ